MNSTLIPDQSVKVYPIVCAAMLMDDDYIIAGVRHFSPDMRATLKRIYGEGYKFKVKDQGFIDTHGNYLSRQDAWIVAKSFDQIKKEVSSPGKLYSENLY